MSAVKIIFLIGGPLTKRWLFNYRIDELAQFFDVEYWDCSALIVHPYRVAEEIKRDYVYQIDSLSKYWITVWYGNHGMLF